MRVFLRILRVGVYLRILRTVRKRRKKEGIGKEFERIVDRGHVHRILRQERVVAQSRNRQEDEHERDGLDLYLQGVWIIDLLRKRTNDKVNLSVDGHRLHDVHRRRLSLNDILQDHDVHLLQIILLPNRHDRGGTNAVVPLLLVENEVQVPTLNENFSPMNKYNHKDIDACTLLANANYILHKSKHFPPVLFVPSSPPS